MCPNVSTLTSVHPREC